MSGRDNRSARVVIMDDISWSEPTPRGRKVTPELDSPEWMRPPSPRFTRDEVDVSIDDDLAETVSRWRADHQTGEPELIEYAPEPDDEDVWGPRPKLMADRPGGRRTVVITGRVADRHIAPRASARGGVPTHARHGFAADRTAMWAVLLCVIVLLVALTSH